MHRSIDLDPEKLRAMYETEKLSQAKIAERLGIHVDTVGKYMAKYGIPRRMKHRLPKHDPIVFTEEQYDFLQGAMLGDGSLCLARGGAGNAWFGYTSRSLQHCEYVARPFSDVLIAGGIKQTSVYDKRTKKTYGRYAFRSQMNTAFTDEWIRWYTDGNKRIPEDLKLSPTVCLVWFIGDGCLSNSKYSQEVKFSTNCFTKKELEEILIPQMSPFEARTNICGRSLDGEPQYGIFIPHRKVKDFLDFIGECPFEDYSYKWSLKEYKNFVAEKQPEVIEKMIEMFGRGCSSGTIAKTVGVDRTTVMKYLGLNGYDYRENLFKKGVIG